MSHLKICGTTNVEDALFCDALKVDFLGFIFYAKSKRSIMPEAAKPMIQQLKHSKAIGLFVEHTTEDIIKIANDLGLWGVQIYADHVIPANVSFKVIAESSLHCKRDYTLFDQSWGSGQAFDTSKLPQDLSRVFLAGGINAGNFTQALSYKPFAIDLVSGVEAYPGKKDFNKIQAIVRLI